MLPKLRLFVDTYREELFLVSVIVLVALISFGFGRLSALESGSGGELEVVSAPVSAEELAELSQKVRLYAEGETPPTDEAEVGESSPTNIVGNKNSKIFHLSACSGAKNMAEANKVFFASIAAATAAGYRPAGNCPGL